MVPLRLHEHDMDMLPASAEGAAEQSAGKDELEQENHSLKDQLEASAKRLDESRARHEQAIDLMNKYQAGCAHAKEEHDKQLASKEAESEKLRTELEERGTALAASLATVNEQAQQLASEAITSQGLRAELEWAGKERVTCARVLATEKEKVAHLKEGGADRANVAAKQKEMMQKKIEALASRLGAAMDKEFRADRARVAELSRLELLRLGDNVLGLDKK